MNHHCFVEVICLHSGSHDMPQKSELCDDFSCIRNHMCFLYIGEIFKILCQVFGRIYFCHAVYIILNLKRFSDTSLHNFSEVKHLFPRC